jgi:hypothetical protein
MDEAAEIVPAAELDQVAAELMGLGFHVRPGVSLDEAELALDDFWLGAANNQLICVALTHKAEELMRIVTDPVAQRVLAEIAARMGITEAPSVHLN